MKMYRGFGGSMKFNARAMMALFLGTMAFMDEVARADESPQLILNPITQSTTLMGKPLQVQETANTLPSNQGVAMQAQSQFLGRQTSLVEASVEAIPAAPAAVTTSTTPASTTPATPALSTSASASSTSAQTPSANNSAATVNPSTGTATPSASPAAGGIQLATTDLYIGGTRVWAGKLKFEKGSFIYSGGVAPTQIPFPIFAYPLGPLMLELDAGVEFEGDLNASLTPGLSYPLADSSLTAKVEASLMASGYVEGYASLWIARGGVGGRLNLVNGSLGVQSFLFMNGLKPQGSYIGSVTLLSGDVYGFVDVNLFLGWRRIIKKDFFKWSGRCYAFQQNSCPAN